MMSHKIKEKREFGDFQTPKSLAVAVTRHIERTGLQPQTILEPSCGRGSFLVAAAKIFPNVAHMLGVEINRDHVNHCRQEDFSKNEPPRILQSDFFTMDWEETLADLPEPLLIIGNPPWVTNAELGQLRSKNLPKKSNFQGYSGMDALTGKSNFDISELMLIQQLGWLQSREGILGVLCKTSVARKVLAYAWKYEYRFSDAKMFKIDALGNFGASVDACFLLVDCRNRTVAKKCEVYDDIHASLPSHSIGYQDSVLIADMEMYVRRKSLRNTTGVDTSYIWRSGLKHDCSKVMELTLSDDRVLDGFGNETELEDTFLFPILKSSDVGNGRVQQCRKVVLVTQRSVGEDTKRIAQEAPLTWEYLQQHRTLLDNRRSSIYKDRPPFSVFGIGEYSFADWKVAISGFYKKLDFKVVGPINNRPTMLDDTINFLPCSSENEARFLAAALNSTPASEFLNSMIFWTEKRPITIEILRRLDIRTLADTLGQLKQYEIYAAERIAKPIRRVGSLGSAQLTFTLP